MDGTINIKLVELGVSKENLGLMSVPLMPVRVLLAVLIGKYISGPTPMTVYHKVYPYR